VADWQAEWKYDGIRAQLVRRGGQLWIWSRGEELITDRFPEVVAQPWRCPMARCWTASCWPGPTTRPAPFQALQQRIQRKTLQPQAAGRSCRCVFIAYDLLEAAGQDLRDRPQQHAPRAVAGHADRPAAALSPLRACGRLAGLAAQREQSRSPRRRGPDAQAARRAYGSGRTKADGLWWKWKIDPLHAWTRC
jgi:DNA ligase-1